jgi:hypothetical protein
MPSETSLMVAFVAIIGLLVLVKAVMRSQTAWHPPHEYGEHLTEWPAPQRFEQTVEIGRG